MMRIAFLACPGTLTSSPARRIDVFEHDIQFAVLRDGLAGRADLAEIDWRAPLEVLSQFDAALLATAWDYTAAKDEFLARLEALEAAGVLVCNASNVVRWNADKHYLAELAEAGAPSIPTIWHASATAADIDAAFVQFGTDRVVAKRRVGSGSDGQFSFVRGDPALVGWQMGQPAMIQPFLPAIQSEGEYSFVFVDGRFSHALVKQAVAGEYRIQSSFGGFETPLVPEPHDLTAAHQIMALLPFDKPPLYARIDMVRVPDGTLAVIEAELIEPYLFPEQGPQFGRMMADATLARIAAHSSGGTQG